MKNCTVQLERLDPEMFKVQLERLDPEMFKVQLERLDPEMFKLDPEMFKVPKLDPEMPQTQKKVKRGIKTYTKEAVENRRRACIRYRKDISSGINLLKKWVPGTKDLIRPEILIETVNYIKKLQNEIKEVKKESKKRVKELEHKIKELETPQTHPSEPPLDPTSTMDVTTTSPTVKEELPEEELLASGECPE